ncbi:MAG: malate dehydrogenase, partial [Thermodesulfobacteriota bacterium]|nr:malate dehydrogenase [Thermodesulfobacteriota bacterium]
KPGMSRDDLLQKNKEIVSSVTKEVVAKSPDCIIIVVSNPLDTMSYVAKVVSGFPKNRVMGMAGVLDTARFKVFVAMELNVSVEDVQALVLGGHGDSMVPLPRYATVGGIPLTQMLSQEKIDQIVTRTRKAGGEIVGLLKTGSAFYSPSASAVQMAESILKDKKRILPSCAYLEGEYGLQDIYFGVPVKLGSTGIEEVLEVSLTDEEAKLVQESGSAVKESIVSLKL